MDVTTKLITITAPAYYNVYIFIYDTTSNNNNDNANNNNDNNKRKPVGTSFVGLNKLTHVDNIYLNNNY